MAKVVTFRMFICLSLFVSLFQAEKSLASLKVGFYETTCPLAEEIVRRSVREAVAKDRGLAASLIRMHFHDCFVRGCDASVLLDSTPGNCSEKHSPVNHPSLQGFELIDAAKATIEAQCPHTVSCADIIAFAARDSTFLAGGPAYSVPSGRRDGTTSLLAEATQNLPFPTLTADQLVRKFAENGLSAKDMVTLSGAHSIGVSHCSSFATRLYNFNSTHRQDPSMNHKFAKILKARCVSLWSSLKAVKRVDPVVPLDAKRPNHLGAEYYKHLMRGRGLLTSDQALVESASTAWLVKENARHGKKWKKEFGQAMVRMGYIRVITGDEGEIRRNCRVVNHRY